MSNKPGRRWARRYRRSIVERVQREVARALSKKSKPAEVRT